MGVRTKFSVAKVRKPPYTIFNINNIWQTKKQVGGEINKYAEMKISGKVNEIKNPSESEMKEARSNDLESQFVLASFPDDDQTTGKLLSVKEFLALIFVLGDPNDTFLDSGFDIEDCPLWSGCRRGKNDNPISCTLPSSIRRLIKEESFDTPGRPKILFYTPKLKDRNEKANLIKK